tara:strand:+ start:313 stop:612 length:300 start_codon:yes stop_codon:yes gene_type:complete
MVAKLMDRDEIVEWVIDHMGGDVMLADGFEEAFVGLCSRFGMEPVAAFDRDKCIEIIIAGSDKNDLTDEELYAEAEEYFEFNVIGAWVGDQTPVFLTLV